MKRLAVETEMKDWSQGRAEGSGAAGEDANYASSVVSSAADLQEVGVGISGYCAGPFSLLGLHRHNGRRGRC